MNIRKTLMLSAVALSFASTPVLANDHGDGHKGGGKMLEQADANGDGVISKQEFLDAHAVKFDEIDTDGDGNITAEDVKSHMEAKRAEKKDEWFGKMDTDGSGEISKEEMEVHRAAMKDKIRARRGGEKPAGGATAE